MNKVASRVQEIPKFLGPLAPPKRRLACQRRLLNRQLVMSAYLGSQPMDPSPEQWRFPTRVSHIRASYHELWVPTDFRQEKFFLDRAYLHLFIRRDERTEDEIVALHCDPNESASSKHYRYKAGPHVHMSTAEDPLHHSHIALNAGNLEDVLRSVADLTSALAVAVTMIDDQVLGLY